MKLRSPAKINLTLDICGRDENGYHLLETTFQEISLVDKIEIERCETGIHIECTNPKIACDRTNLVHKAICVMESEAEKLQGPCNDCAADEPQKGRFGGLKIKIEKNIPVGAGLGGGSSNAAAVMKACNELWELNWSKDKLAKLAAKVGMDVPFFIYGGTALGTHYCEEIEPVPYSPKLNVLVVKPKEKALTKEMYAKIDLEKCGLNLDRSRGLLADLMRKNDNIFGYVGNDFETLLEDDSWKLGKEIQAIRDDFWHFEAQAVAMCGSGSAVFGLFADWQGAMKAEMFLSKKYDFVWSGKTAEARA